MLKYSLEYYEKTSFISTLVESTEEFMKIQRILFVMGYRWFNGSSYIDRDYYVGPIIIAMNGIEENTMSLYSVNDTHTYKTKEEFIRLAKENMITIKRNKQNEKI